MGTFRRLGPGLGKHETKPSRPILLAAEIPACIRWSPPMTDYLVAMCDSCGHHVRVSLEHGGRRAKCPKCAAIIEIPKTESGILRLRTVTELTRETRAKAGRGGPDSDPTVPVAEPVRS